MENNELTITQQILLGILEAFVLLVILLFLFVALCVFYSFIPFILIYSLGKSLFLW